MNYLSKLFAFAASGLIAFAAPAAEPVFRATFDKDLCGFSISDGNEDGIVWVWDEGAARCASNWMLAMDDWLVSPAVRLESGKKYKLKFDARGYYSATERLEVKLGRSPQAEAMTETLVRATDITGPKDFEAWIVPQEPGDYYIGFHGISAKDRRYLYVDNVEVGAGVEADGPAAVSNLTAVAVEGGENAIVISFDAPDRTLGGADLTVLGRIEILREDVVVKTYENPAPGSHLEFTDELPRLGTYNYTVVAYDVDGVAGKEALVSCFCGVARPVCPDWIVIEQDPEDPCNAIISWEEVTEDITGRKLNPGKITYRVTVNDHTSEPLSTTSYKYKVVDAGQQAWVGAVVVAYTEAGQSDWTLSNLTIIGTPYTGMDESFAGGEASCVWASDQANGAQFAVLKDDQVDGLASVDADGGYLGCYGASPSYSADYFSGKIDLSGMKSPGLTFYTYNIPGQSVDNNQVAISIFSPDGHHKPVMVTGVAQTAGADNQPGWHRVTVPLTQYAGQTVQLVFTCVSMNYQWTYIDAITVGEIPANELSAGPIVCPGAVSVGQDYTVTLPVTNNGTEAAEGYIVELTVDGQTAATAAGPRLEPNSSGSVTLTLNMPSLAQEPVAISGSIVYDADEVPENNAYAQVSVAPRASRLPAVSGLRATTDGGVSLSWDRPDVSAGFIEPVTVGFEDGEDFAWEYPGWTMTDRDGKPLGGFIDLEIPGLEAETTTGAFFVFNGSTYPASFRAHGGDKYLASLFAYDGTDIDDWAISPALLPVAQTVELYARSYAGYYPERLRILYSTGSTDPEDFVELLDVKNVPGVWTRYSVELPVGAARLALNSCATNAFMLMVDDLRFIPADGEAHPLEITGYRVYRDGIAIDDTPVTSTAYTDAGTVDGTHEYAVTALYAGRGESGPCRLDVNVAGLTDAIAETLRVTADDGSIEITGATGLEVTVVAADGRLLYRGVAGDLLRVPTAPGVYIVTASTRSQKALVR